MPNNDILIKIMALNYAKSELQSAGKDVRNFGKAAGDADGKMVGLAGSIRSVGIAAGVTFSVGALLAFGKEAFDTSLQVERILKPIEAIEQSNAPVALKFLHDEADRLGQNFYDLAAAWGQVSAAAKGTALQGEPLRRIFTGINEASVTLAKTGGDVKGMFYAIMQMISKGRVSAEELRRQLGDRLPGAFQMAADAMGVTTAQLDKMLEQGELLAVDLLPKLADVLHEKYGKTAVENASESQKAVNKFSEEWTTLKANLVNSDAAVGGIKAVTAAVGELNDVIVGIPVNEVLEKHLEALPGKYEEALKALEAYETRRAQVGPNPFTDNTGRRPGTTFEAQKQHLRDALDLVYAARQSLAAMAASSVTPDIEPPPDGPSRKYTEALEKVREELEQIGKKGKELEMAKLDQWFGKEAETLGKTNAELLDLYNKRKAAIEEKFDNQFAEELASIRNELELIGLEGKALDLKKLDQWFAGEAEKVGAENEQLKALYAARKAIIEKTFTEKAEEQARGFREELALIGVEGKALAQVKLDQWLARVKREAGEVTPEMQALYDAQKQVIEDQYKWEEAGPLGGVGMGFEQFAEHGKLDLEGLADVAEDSADRINTALNDAIWDAEANVADAAQAMAKDLSSMALKQGFTVPIFGMLSGALGFEQHAGGKVGSGPLRIVPSDTFNGARRHHSGGPVLRPGEVGVIAEEDELILNAAMKKNLAARLGGGGNVYNFTANLDMPAPSGNQQQDEAFLNRAAQMLEGQFEVFFKEKMQREMLPGGSMNGGPSL